MTWDPTRLPDQTGRTFVVTGATAGIGYFAAEQLAAAGAHVVLASRSAAKLAVAEEAIRGQVPGARTSSVVIDLASLESVEEAASAMPAFDGILLNGGAMAFGRTTTADGLPMLLGTHVVANTALIAALLPTLSDARIVHTSTGFVSRFPQRVDDLLHEPRIGVLAYTKAKTATEVFAFELDRRLRAAGSSVASIVTRPGVGVDAKTPTRPGIRDSTTAYQRNPYTPWAQGKDTAAWSAVRALTDPAAQSGEYYGPAGGIRGLPVRVPLFAPTATPEGDLATRVWDQLEALAGVRVAA